MRRPRLRFLRLMSSVKDADFLGQAAQRKGHGSATWASSGPHGPAVEPVLSEAERMRTSSISHGAFTSAGVFAMCSAKTIRSWASTIPSPQAYGPMSHNE